MRKSALSFTVTSALVLVAISLPGCIEGESNSRLSNEEIDLFEQKLTEAGSIEGACKELDVLCNTTGFGCTAHEVFCNVPTKEYICQQLASACATYPAACDVYNDRCNDTLPPQHDGAVVLPDAGAPTLDGTVPPEPLDCSGILNCAAFCVDANCLADCIARAQDQSTTDQYLAVHQCVSDAAFGECSGDCASVASNCYQCLTNACESQIVACMGSVPPVGLGDECDHPDYSCPGSLVCVSASETQSFCTKTCDNPGSPCAGVPVGTAAQCVPAGIPDLNVCAFVCGTEQLAPACPASLVCSSSAGSTDTLGLCLPQ